MIFKTKTKKILSISLLLALMGSGTSIAENRVEENAEDRTFSEITTVNSIFMNKALNAPIAFDARMYKYYGGNNQDEDEEEEKKSQYENSEWSVTMAKLLEMGVMYGSEYSADHIDEATAQDGPYKDTAHYRNIGTGGNALVALGYMTSGKGPVADGGNTENKKADIKIKEYKRFLPVYKYNIDMGNMKLTDAMQSWRDGPGWWRDEGSVEDVLGNDADFGDARSSATGYLGSAVGMSTVEFLNIYYNRYQKQGYYSDQMLMLHDGSLGGMYTGGQLEKNREEIKEHIVNYGAVAASIYYDPSCRFTGYYDFKEQFKLTSHREGGSSGGDVIEIVNGGYEGKILLVKGGLAYYYNKDKEAVPNHDLLIIGWDDNYSQKYTGAPGDGAWLVWDSEYITKGNQKSHLYYVSYYDYFIESNVYGITGTDMVDYDNIYQLDPLGMSTSITGVMSVEGYTGQNMSDVVYGANVFLRKDKDKPELLKEVSVAIEIPTQVEVYVNPRVNSTKDIKEQLKEENLIKVSELTDKLDPGYHTIKLDKQVYLTDESFAVIVKYVADTNSANFNEQMAKIGVQSPVKISYKQNGSEMEKVATEVPYFQNAGEFAKEGQCFTSYEMLEWADITSDSDSKDMTLCIKAFTEEADAYEIEPEKVYFTKEEIDINKGDTEQLEAIVEPEDVSESFKKLYWSSEDNRIAKVDQNGVVQGVGAGKVKIRAAARTYAGEDLYAEILVNVNIPMEQVTLNQKDVTILANESYVLVPILSPEDATIKEIKWSSKNPKVCRVTESGFLVGMEKGKTRITLTITDRNGNTKTADCNVTVPEGLVVGVTGITMENSQLTLQQGTRQDLKATITPEDATNKEIIWTSDKTSVVSVNKQTGRINTIQPGTATITATTSDGGYQATCKITVTERVNSAVTGVTISPKIVSVEKGKTKQLTAAVTPVDSTNTKVSWKSSNTDIVNVGNTGIITGLKAGTATITVTTEDGNKTDTCEVTVTERYVGAETVTVTPTAKAIDIDNASQKTFQLKATVQPFTASNTGVTFESSDTSIATVDENGKVTVLSEGTVTITVKAKDNNDAKATCIIQATKHVDVTGFTLKDSKGNALTEQSELEIKEGITTKVDIIDVTPDTATYETSDFEWSSSDEEVVKVNNGKIYAVPQTRTSETEEINRTATVTVKIKNQANQYVTKTFKVKTIEVSLDDVNLLSSEYEITEDNLIIVPLKTTVGTFKENLSIITDYGITYELINLQNNKITNENQYVGTGMKLRIVKAPATLENWTENDVVVYDILVIGDSITKEIVEQEERYVAGDGKLDAKDVVMANNVGLGIEKLTGYEKFLIALDVNRDGEYAQTDDIAIMTDELI